MRALTTWRPFPMLGRRDDLFEDFLRDTFRFGEAGAGLLEPAAEIAESHGEITVKLEVPGVDKKDLHVSVTDDAITVRGETRKEREETKRSFYRQEIRYGAFQRSMPLPAEVDADKAAATLENGMLTITIPKMAAGKAKHLDIPVA
ncbi:MAG: Hsp20/alpha crystallin family protein [bacterium]|nr:Hsp20/alpha crystallin family protein [bacterium]